MANKPLSDLCSYVGWSLPSTAGGATASAGGLFGVSSGGSGGAGTTLPSAESVAAPPTPALAVVAHTPGLGCASIDWVVAEWINIWMKAGATAATAAPKSVQTPKPVVILISVMHSFVHYFSVTRKLGTNLVVASAAASTAAASVTSTTAGSGGANASAFHFIDLISAPFRTALQPSTAAASGDAKSNTATAASSVSVSSGLSYPSVIAQIEAITKLATASAPICIAVDNLTLIAAANSRSDTLNFISYLQAVIAPNRGALLLCGEGTAIPPPLASTAGALKKKAAPTAAAAATASLDTSHDPILTALSHRADTVLSVSPLVSGVSKDVHGQILVWARLPTADAGARAIAPITEHTQLLHYKVQEQSVKVFLRGQTGI